MGKKEKILTGLAILTIILINVFVLTYPLPRQVGLSVRYDLLPVIIAAGLLFLCWYRSSLPGQILSLGLICLLLNLSLTGLWASGQSEVYVLNGVIPWNDASHYYTDALRILAGGSMEAFSTRRPLAPLFFSLILFVTGQNVQMAQVCLALVSGVSIYLAGRQIRKDLNALSAVFFVILMFLFIRRFTGMLMTENLGFPLGTLAFVLLWRGISRNYFKELLLGILAITLALNARAGAFFIIPGLLLCVSWVACNRFKHIKREFWVVVVVLLGFGTNLLAFKLVSPPGAMLFSNFADTLYGTVAGGKGWAQVASDHPELNQLSEEERSTQIYRLTYEKFISEPFLVVEGSLKSWVEYFSLSQDSVFGFINGERKNEVKGSIVLSILLIYGLCALGIYFLIKNRKHPLAYLMGSAWLGIVLSVPLVPPSDATRMRVYAATVVFSILLPTLGVFTLGSLFKKKGLNLRLKLAEEPQRDWIPFGVAGGLAVLVCLGGVFLRFAAVPVVFEAPSCPGDQIPVVFQLTPGSQVHVVKDESAEYDWLPEIREKRFIIGIHGISTGFSSELEMLKVPYRLMGGINLINQQSIFVVMPDGVEKQNVGLMKACGNKIGGDLLNNAGFVEINSSYP